MDPALTSSINRRDARLIAEHLDRLDVQFSNETPWSECDWADRVMSDRPEHAADRAWIVGALGHATPGLYFDGDPADSDWEDLYSHIRAEILARRAPQKTSSVRAAQKTPCGMV